MKLLLLAIFFSFNASFSEAQDTVLNESRPFVLGRINEIYSKTLAEKRVVNIYLPEGYNEKDSTSYPVIYLLDGSADEDFIHIAGLIQFLNFPWVNILPKSILVGIANVDRKRDFTFPTSVSQDKIESPTSGGSENFISFIEKELQPFIEKNYKTNSSKTIIGQSLGGLLATEILFKKPALFTRYIIVSPSLWWNNESLLSTKPILSNSSSVQPTSVYIAVGNEGKIMKNDAHRLISILRSYLPKKTVIHFQYFPHEDHATILHRAVYDAFEYLK
jgi:predicted alpha/beta superfamily hydrolase